MTDLAWLIEAPGPYYLGVRELPMMHGEFYWTREPNKALRLFNAEQADHTMLAVRRMEPRLFMFTQNLGDAVVREHGWLAEEA